MLMANFKCKNQNSLQEVMGIAFEFVACQWRAYVGVAITHVAGKRKYDRNYWNRQL